MTPTEFLKLLWQDKPAHLHVLIWTRQGKQSHWFRGVAAAAEFVQKARGVDVYVGVGLAERDYGPGRRCPSVEIAGIAGFWADLDLKSDAHQKALPASIEDALTILPAGLQPSVIVATGNGAHTWWLFKEPWIFKGAEERGQAAALISRFQTLLRYNAQQRGWAFDRLADLARVLRIPGTINAKDPNSPKEVTVHSCSDHRYGPSDFKQCLDDHSIPDPEAEALAAKTRTGELLDRHLRLDLTARIPQELLEGWMEDDLRFKSTWHRQRLDLSDSSQSGYDMALAAFGVSSGLTEQQIVDLIVHHRSSHKRKQCTVLSYFLRTISKAKNRMPEPGTGARLKGPGIAIPPALGSGTCPSDPGDSVDPAMRKAQLCDRLSEALGFRILRIVKVTGREPVYRLELESGKVAFSHVSKLVGQASLRMAIAAQVDTLIPKRGSKIWDQIAQMILSALTEEDGGEEMQWEGSARIYINQYLSRFPLIDSIEGQSEHTAHLPLIENDHILINSPDFLAFLNKETGQTLSVKDITAMLSVVGGKNKRVRGNFREQSRWVLPRSEFDPATYAKHYEEDCA